MLKIGIYAKSIDRKITKEAIIRYLNQINVEAEISYVKTKYEILKIYDSDCNYNIIIICENNKIHYVRRTSINHEKKALQLNSRIIDGCLNDEILDEIFLSIAEYGCPHGIYKLYNKEILRLIPYEDIEYFHFTTKESLVFLVNNESEKITHSSLELEKQLPKEYFITAQRGYLVNLYNVKKLFFGTHKIVFKSGKSIPYSRKNFQKIIKQLLKVVYGFNLWD